MNIYYLIGVLIFELLNAHKHVNNGQSTERKSFLYLSNITYVKTSIYSTKVIRSKAYLFIYGKVAVSIFPYVLKRMG